MWKKTNQKRFTVPFKIVIIHRWFYLDKVETTSVDSKSIRTLDKNATRNRE